MEKWGSACVSSVAARSSDKTMPRTPAMPFNSSRAGDPDSVSDSFKARLIVLILSCTSESILPPAIFPVNGSADTLPTGVDTSVRTGEAP